MHPCVAVPPAQPDAAGYILPTHQERCQCEQDGIAGRLQWYPPIRFINAMVLHYSPPGQQAHAKLLVQIHNCTEPPQKVPEQIADSHHTRTLPQAMHAILHAPPHRHLLPNVKTIITQQGTNATHISNPITHWLLMTSKVERMSTYTFTNETPKIKTVPNNTNLRCIQVFWL